jgi:hypothetical protein
MDCLGYISPVLEFDGTLQGSHCPAFQHWLEAIHSVRSGDNHKAEQVVESDGKVRVGRFTDKMGHAAMLLSRENTIPTRFSSVSKPGR